MVITVNGEKRDVPDGITILKLLEMLLPGKSLDGIAVSLNDEIVEREMWSCLSPTPDSSIEIIRAFQGG
ncbi:MAG: sulfur carrier protein ThiS [Candidatus Dadabacteria bacterium]|nr:MAG: sulfur carrier protein ThiS [Candidatus Dadabacteria bacterium]